MLNITNNATPLWPHQKAAIESAGDRFALFFDPGTGKTRTAIELYKRSRKQYFVPNGGGKKGKVLIFAPINVVRNWQNELGLYLHEPYRCFIVAGGTKARKLKTIDEFTDSTEQKHLFLICNIETLWSEEYRKGLARCGASFVIIDESHNLKSPNSAQTKGALEILAKLKPASLYLLTGTPAPQGEIDLWSTFFMLGVTKDNFFIWRRKHFADRNERRRGSPNYWPDYVVTKSSRELFQTELADCSMTAKKDEVLGLPELLRTNIYAEMSPEQCKYYESMKEYLFAVDQDGNELNAANLLSRTIRLQQILAGFLGGDVAIKNNPRLAALDSAIELTQGEQFIIWTIFKSTYKQIAEKLDALGVSFGMLTGQQTSEERHQTMASFQAGDIRCVIGHPRAGGVGVNLTAASYSIHYTRSYSLVDDLQAEARNYRGGSEIHKRITRIDIITPDTIDEEIVAALKEKKSVQDFILQLKGNHERRAA